MKNLCILVALMTGYASADTFRSFEIKGQSIQSYDEAKNRSLEKARSQCQFGNVHRTSHFKINSGFCEYGEPCYTAKAIYLCHKEFNRPIPRPCGPQGCYGY